MTNVGWRSIGDLLDFIRLAHTLAPGRLARVRRAAAVYYSGRESFIV